jgi:flavin reductase (DIM6/NTAB) family NADH-FMN oxidoreductase RutF
MTNDNYSQLETLDVGQPIWEQFFTVSPLVLIGTMEENGDPDFAPKHMAFPIGLENYFGFVCTPHHRTHRNVERTKNFTVSYPRPSDLVMTSLTAAPRCEDNKPIVGLLDTFPARRIEGKFVEHAYLYLECERTRIVEGFGDYSLIAGQVVAAHVHPDALRGADRDDGELLLNAPQLAYLFPGRFAVIDKTEGFPFPAGMHRGR